MIGRILLDNDVWLITSGLLGGVKITHKPRNLTIKPNRYERSYLFDILDELKKRGDFVAQNRPEFENVIELFAEAVFGRGDARWQAFFQGMTCEQIAEQSINTEKSRRASKSIKEGLRLAELDREFKEASFREHFGCAGCRDFAKASVDYEDLPFRKVKTIVETSHYSFWVSECTFCKQPYLEVFNEKVGWENGEDEMWSTWLPITTDEVAILHDATMSDKYDITYINKLLEKLMQMRDVLMLDPQRKIFWINRDSDD